MCRETKSVKAKVTLLLLENEPQVEGEAATPAWTAEGLPKDVLGKGNSTMEDCLSRKITFAVSDLESSLSLGWVGACLKLDRI